MSQRVRLLTIGLIACLLVSVISVATTVYYYQQYSNANQNYVTAQQKYLAIRGVTLNVSMTINYGNGTLKTTKSVYLSIGANVLDALNAVATVNISYSTYGVYIYAVNNVLNNKNGNNLYWQYYINGVYAIVGADQYKLNDGDQIKWVYQSF